MNRARIARENAGLGVGQALRYLAQGDEPARTIDRDALIRIEEMDSAFYDAGISERLAHLYGVSVEWLRGEIPQHDYAALDAIDGADKLSSADRAALAEVLAARQRKEAM